MKEQVYKSLHTNSEIRMNKSDFHDDRFRCSRKVGGVEIILRFEKEKKKKGVKKKKKRQPLKSLQPRLQSPPTSSRGVIPLKIP